MEDITRRRGVRPTTQHVAYAGRSLGWYPNGGRAEPSLQREPGGIGTVFKGATLPFARLSVPIQPAQLLEAVEWQSNTR